MSDPGLRRAFLEFEIALDAVAADEVGEEDWGRALLSPTLPLVWDASYIALERTGLGMASVEALADGALGAAGLAHRTVVVVDETDGERLAEEAEAAAGWTAERTRYMVWHGEQSAAATPGVREVPGAAAVALRRRLMLESMPPDEVDPEATAEQLLELDRRLDEAGGDRRFIAPDDGPAASTCRLLRDGRGTGQIEDVATLRSARGEGLATAVVNAALAASRTAGDSTTFIAADAADWPQLLYEKLGFVPVGTLHVLRRRPTRPSVVVLSPP